MGLVMRLKNSKNNLERSVALFEIVLMVLSVLTISYLIGSEIELISAIDSVSQEDALKTVAENEVIPSWKPPATSPTTTPVYSGASDLVRGTTPIPESAGAGTPTSEWHLFGEGGIPGWKERFSSAGKSIGGTATVASIIWATTFLITAYAFGTSEGYAKELSWTLTYGFAAGQIAAIVAEFFAPGAGGALTANLIPGFWGSFFSITPAGLIGLGLAAVYALFAYREVEVEIVTFTCNPWQPVSGKEGQNCEECNKGQFPCTKYKCESLGASCELVNEEFGEKEVLCVWKDRNDPSPPEISPWKEALLDGFNYTPDTKVKSPDKGVFINYTNSADGCIPPFTTINFGVTLNKVAECRVDWDRSKGYEEMNNPGLTSLGRRLYNHSIVSFHIGATELKQEELDTLVAYEEGGVYELHVRCNDSNGNANLATFVFKYCIQEGADINEPVIGPTSIKNGAYIAKGTTEQDIIVDVNKPSDCKWSRNDVSYESMENSMNCVKSITEINNKGKYSCETTLTGLKDLTENKFYFKCESYPDKEGTEFESERRTMTESYVYTLIGTKELVIDSVTPNNTIVRDSTENVKVTIEVKTSSGANKGESLCYYKQSDETENSYVPFITSTEYNYKHLQDLFPQEGNYNYDIKCCDLGGNCDTERISFSVETDTEAPKVIRIYKEGSELKLVTNEKSECVYDTTSCNYVFDNGVKISSFDGVQHNIGWSTQDTLYIKCKDDFEGQPSAETCTIIIRPSDTF
jgi:hypothetical protein